METFIYIILILINLTTLKYLLIYIFILNKLSIVYCYIPIDKAN
jgi:hypothetical protein